MNDASWMAREGAKFITVNTPRPAVGGGFVLLLKANPRRYYVEFFATGGLGATPGIYPGPLPDTTAAGGKGATSGPYKFKDCPSITTGEFYFFDDGVTNLFITECIYTGE